MDRRHFLAGGASFGAVGMASSDASAGPRPIPESELDAMLAELDHDLARMRRRRPLAPVRRGLARAGLPEDMLGQTLATLTLASEWKASSEAVQQSPAFRSRLDAALPEFTRNLLQLTSWIEVQPRRTRRLGGRMLRRPNHAHEALDVALMGKGKRASTARRGHLRRNFGVLSKLVKRRGADGLFDAVVHDVDTICAHAGVDRLDVVGGGEASAGVRDDDRLREVGWILIGGAAGAVVLGLLALLAEAIGVAIVLTIFLAPLLLLAGIIVLIVGAVQLGKAARSRPSERGERLVQLIQLSGASLPT